MVTENVYMYLEYIRTPQPSAAASFDGVSLPTKSFCSARAAAADGVGRKDVVFSTLTIYWP